MYSSKPDAPACSAVRHGNFFGRNYDWYYDTTATFVIYRKPTQGRFASIGVAGSLIEELDANSGEYSDLYKYLPFATVDGINENGVICEMNVLADTGLYGRTTGTNPGKPDVPVKCLIRRVLDEAESADDAINKIKNDWNIIDTNIEYELHLMIADKDKTYVVEFINNDIKVIEDFVNDKPVMTNFYLTYFDGNTSTAFYKPETYNPETTTLTPHAMGLERYDILAAGLDAVNTAADMVELMKKVRYTLLYREEQDPRWFSEYADGEFTIDTPAEAYMPGVQKVIEAFKDPYKHKRNVGFWQTVHSSTYDIENKELSIIFQENDKVYTFSIPLLGEKTQTSGGGGECKELTDAETLALLAETGILEPISIGDDVIIDSSNTILVF